MISARIGNAMNYKSKRWNILRQRILRLDGYADIVARRYGKMREANMVHHIYPADKYPEYEWEEWNLISLSNETHNRMHDRATGELTSEGLRLMKRIKPYENWRKKAHFTK